MHRILILLSIVSSVLATPALSRADPEETIAQEDENDVSLSLNASSTTSSTPAWVLHPTTPLMFAERPMKTQFGSGGDSDFLVGGILGGIIDIALTQVAYRTLPGGLGEADNPGWKSAGLTFAVSSFAVPLVSAMPSGKAYLTALLCGVIVKGITGLLAMPFLADQANRSGGAVILTIGSVLTIPAYLFGGLIGGDKFWG